MSGFNKPTVLTVLGALFSASALATKKSQRTLRTDNPKRMRQLKQAKGAVTEPSGRTASNFFHTAPTADEKKRIEREEWNRKIEERKAAKKAAKGKGVSNDAS